MLNKRDKVRIWIQVKSRKPRQVSWRQVFMTLFSSMLGVGVGCRALRGETGGPAQTWVPASGWLGWGQMQVRKGGPGRPGDNRGIGGVDFLICILLNFLIKVLFEYLKSLLAMEPFAGDVMLSNESNLGWGHWGWTSHHSLTWETCHWENAWEVRRHCSRQQRGWRSGRGENREVMADNSSCSAWGPGSAYTGALAVT